MENSYDPPTVKKLVGKTHPLYSESLVQHEGLKRSTGDDVAESLDLEVGKRKKLANEKIRNPANLRQIKENMCLESSGNSVDISVNPELENVSLMSINFSQYEMLRNLSHSNFRSDGGSQSTCSTISVDRDLKNEHLERYFKSVDTWNKQFEGTKPDSPENM